MILWIVSSTFLLLMLPYFYYPLVKLFNFFASVFSIWLYHLPTSLCSIFFSIYMNYLRSWSWRHRQRMMPQKWRLRNGSTCENNTKQTDSTMHIFKRKKRYFRQLPYYIHSKKKLSSNNLPYSATSAASFTFFQFSRPPNSFHFTFQSESQSSLIFTQTT